MSIVNQALHFVLKVGVLTQNVRFFRDQLGMQVLRHEVFEQGCEAACNGPYGGKWSKTMIGYGPEDTNFVLELVYNYTVGSYKLGNDLQFIKISLKPELFDQVRNRTEKISTSEQNQTLNMKSPDGYQFIVVKDDAIKRSDITEVCLSSSNLNRSLAYWSDLLKMRRYGDVANKTEATLRYADDQSALRLKQISEPVDHKSAFGRMAYSCPSKDLKPLQASVEAAKGKILTPYVSLDTPGKASVQVVILADPDGHEICFVGDEGFKELSQVDPNANSLIEKAMAEDKSDEWYSKKGLKKDES